jgi:hypothetical protein
MIAKEVKNILYEHARMRPDRIISDYAFDELLSLSMLPDYKEDQ